MLSYCFRFRVRDARPDRPPRGCRPRASPLNFMVCLCRGLYPRLRRFGPCLPAFLFQVSAAFQEAPALPAASGTQAVRAQARRAPWAQVALDDPDSPVVSPRGLELTWAAPLGRRKAWSEARSWWRPHATAQASAELLNESASASPVGPSPFARPRCQGLR